MGINSMSVMDESDLRKRLHLIKEWNRTCIICGEEFAHLACVTREHIVPRSKGGKQADNIAPSHYNCNNIRADKSLIEADQIVRWTRRRMGEAAFKKWIARPQPSCLVPPMAMMDIDTVLQMYDE
jgi:5-methylcytosine-specific restriction endonuclease McrA